MSQAEETLAAGSVFPENTDIAATGWAPLFADGLPPAGASSADRAPQEQKSVVPRRQEIVTIGSLTYLEYWDDAAGDYCYARLSPHENTAEQPPKAVTPRTEILLRHGGVRFEAIADTGQILSRSEANMLISGLQSLSNALSAADFAGQQQSQQYLPPTHTHVGSADSYTSESPQTYSDELTDESRRGFTDKAEVIKRTPNVLGTIKTVATNRRFARLLKEGLIAWTIVGTGVATTATVANFGGSAPAFVLDWLGADKLANNLRSEHSYGLSMKNPLQDAKVIGWGSVSAVLDFKELAEGK